jgi:hypothetical protein
VWDGSGFTIRLPQPYANPSDTPRTQYCAAIDQDAIGVMNQSITYNTYLDQYVLVGDSADTFGGREVWGVYYALSDDLIHWSRRQLLMEAELTWTYQPGDDDPILYPALLDPDSESRNFETTDQDAYLYYTQNHYRDDQQTLDRDLVRVPVRFETRAVTAPEYEFTLSGNVPGNATQALVGYRINTECDCADTAEFALYGVQYTEGNSSRNRVPNGIFVQGMTNWTAWGAIQPDVIASDLSDTQALHVTAAPEEDAALNGTLFEVEPGAPFTVTFVARVEAVTGDAGYFTLIFMDGSREIGREQIPLVPNVLE